MKTNPERRDHAWFALADADPVTQKAEYDTSSGDSCWVRQYLEWCDLAIAIPSKAGLEFAPAGVRRFYST